MLRFASRFVAVLLFSGSVSAQQLPRELLEVGAGAVAKITASAVFLADRTVESVLDGEFSKDDRFGAMLQPMLDIDVGYERKSVTASLAGVSRTAVYRPGLGCALVLDGVLPAGEDEAAPSDDADLTAQPWPRGEADAEGDMPYGGDAAQLDAALDAAFVGHHPPLDPRTRAVVVVHRGKIIGERYASGFARETRLHGWSMTKSVVDALVGIRVGQEAMRVDEPVGLPLWSAAKDARATLDADTLLRMSSGLEWTERYDDLMSDVPRMLFAETDACGFAAARALADEPGTVWSYSSGTSNILCGVLRATFESLAEYHVFPRRELFDRIGMRSAVIETDPGGTFVGSSYMYATARDWARFGLLYLGDGVFDGERILPEGWVAASTTPTAGADRGRYGRHWWLNAGTTRDGQNRVYPSLPADMFYASGYEGQTVAVLPAHETVFVRLGCTKQSRSFRDGIAIRAVLDALPPPRGYSIPTVDLSADAERQVVVDREPGVYLGHPTTVQLADGETIVCVYPKGHGEGAIVMKRSIDGGRTWSARQPVPASWATSREVPTIHRIGDRLVMFSGLHPIRRSVSEDGGVSWSELEPIGPFGGIVAMSDVIELADGRHMAFFHDDGRFLAPTGERSGPPRFRVYRTVTADGGMTWSEPSVVATHDVAHLCEAGAVRSPDGERIALLLRENARELNSFIVFSDDEGETWTEPRMLPGALTGDRHQARYLPDGRLFVSFRDTALVSATRGDWVGWVGTWDDLVNGGEGHYRVRLMANHHRWDCGYSGVEVLADGTVVATSYGHWTAGEKPYVVSVRFRVEELDAPAASPR